MARATNLLASAAVGSLIVVGGAALARAQVPTAIAGQPGAVGTSGAAGRAVQGTLQGAIQGTVRDEHGVPIADVVVSALGTTTTVAVTDKNGRFEFGSLAAGPYLLRAHLT